MTTVIIENIKVPYRPNIEKLDDIIIGEGSKIISKKLGSKPIKANITKISIDARKKDSIVFVASISADIETDKSDDYIKNLGFKIREDKSPVFVYGSKKSAYRPVVVGFGPAGMFAGLALAENGYAPIIFERGDAVDERVRKVDEFTNGGKLDTESNVQFGAGGAGTFSDGKLTTRINDSYIGYVMTKLHDMGAPDEIMYKAKPHIGTDVLRNVVSNIHNRIIELGGEIHYNSRVSDITENTVKVNGETVPFSTLILAVGHSAHDVYSELINKGYLVEPKPFSCGVRVEHLQSDIDRMLFGSLAGDKNLGKGEYQLSYRSGDRGTYTFCMCPGGFVMPSSSEADGIVTNGMSKYARDNVNANSAVCVSVNPADYGNNPSGAIEFQRMLEKNAFEAGGRTFTAPCQLIGDYLNDTVKHEPKRVMPSYMNGNVKMTNLRKLFPGFISSMLEDGLRDFGRKMKGFDAEDIPLTGVETRTSAPVRITRNENMTAIGHDNIYPCGEGAGYAGGIVSAAVDGLRIAMKIMSEYAPNNN